MWFDRWCEGTMYSRAMMVKDTEQCEKDWNKWSSQIIYFNLECWLTRTCMLGDSVVVGLPPSPNA